jgi:hypothetical protein
MMMFGNSYFVAPFYLNEDIDTCVCFCPTRLLDAKKKTQMKIVSYLFVDHNNKCNSLKMKIDSVSQTVLLFTLVHTGSSGWVDPDTSANFQGTAALTKGDNRQYELVSSTLNAY